MSAAFVYMVRCTGGRLYTGWTTDVARRLQAHQTGKGAKFTKAFKGCTLAYTEACADKSAALRREAALKKLPKAKKEELCAGWGKETGRESPASAARTELEFGTIPGTGTEIGRAAGTVTETGTKTSGLV